MERRKDGSDSQSWAHTSLPNVHPQRLLPAPVTHLPTPCSNSLWREPISCSASKSTPLSALFLIPAELQAPSLAVPRARCSQRSARGLPFSTHTLGSCPAGAQPHPAPGFQQPLNCSSRPSSPSLPTPTPGTIHSSWFPFSRRFLHGLSILCAGSAMAPSAQRSNPEDLLLTFKALMHSTHRLPPLPPLLPQDTPPCIRARAQLEWRSQFRAGSPRVLGPPTQRQASSEGEDSVWPWCSWGSTMPPPSALAHLSEHVQQSMQQGNDDMPEVFTYCLENRRPRGIYWAGARGGAHHLLAGHRLGGGRCGQEMG